MRRRLKVVVGLLAATPLGLVGAIALLYRQISHPPVEQPPLPGALVALPSPMGQALLATATATADHEALAAALQRQEKRTWCGVASSVTVLSAMRGARVPQDAFFTDATAEVRSWTRITFGGMTLDALGALLEAHGVEAGVHHAGGGVDAFRERALANLATPGDYLLVNYLRTPLGQGDTGHISPVSAYHAGSDRFLVLDVASYAWPPVWVRADDLYGAMETVDPESDTLRGWVEVAPR